MDYDERPDPVIEETNRERIRNIVHDELALGGFPDEQFVDLVLGHRVCARPLADVDQFGVIPAAGQEGWVCQAVVEDGIGLCDPVKRGGGDKARVSGSCANEHGQWSLCLLSAHGWTF